ncbi:Arabinanase/levansucrase/invertase [Podospora didyma]|uniref:Arabinanase/levansucrase/invertase n=1 Tax=Podospora didyma TaxID=330526 RepID=A0AAE0P3M6_9PEZI|nr:Arabinanase/levansucrase/invertase [Podospora didyma]
MPLITFALITSLCFAALRSLLGNTEFADPSIAIDPHAADWYAFATQGNGKHVQVASSPLLYGPWTLLSSYDLLPIPGKWVDTSGPSPNYWAPDVQYIQSTQTFVLYYSALRSDSRFHCVGVAISRGNITGPYTAHDEPFICPLDGGGAIDASGYHNLRTWTRWVVYKVDGSAKGSGGPCGNADPPGQPTPIMLQHLNADDGFTLIGDPITILNRDPEVDGPLIEAPSLIRVSVRNDTDDEDEGGVFILFYSSHCWNTHEYDIKYATATDIRGPYTRRGTLLGRGAGNGGCLHQIDFEVDGSGKVTVVV